MSLDSFVKSRTIGQIDCSSWVLIRTEICGMEGSTHFETNLNINNIVCDKTSPRCITMYVARFAAEKSLVTQQHPHVQAGNQLCRVCVARRTNSPEPTASNRAAYTNVDHFGQPNCLPTMVGRSGKIRKIILSNMYKKCLTTTRLLSNLNSSISHKIHVQMQVCILLSV